MNIVPGIVSGRGPPLRSGRVKTVEGDGAGLCLVTFWHLTTNNATILPLQDQIIFFLPSTPSMPRNIFLRAVSAPRWRKIVLGDVLAAVPYLTKIMLPYHYKIRLSSITRRTRNSLFARHLGAASRARAVHAASSLRAARCCTSHTSFAASAPAAQAGKRVDRWCRSLCRS